MVKNRPAPSRAHSATVRLAVQRSKPPSWQDLVQLFGKPMGAIVKRGDFEKYIANLDRLRSRTIEAAGNVVLAAEQLRRANIRSSREYLERFQSFVL